MTRKERKESLMEEKHTRKHTLTVLKDWIAENDLRSLLALIVTTLGLVVIAIRPETAPFIAPIVLTILAWYFKERER